MGWELRKGLIVTLLAGTVALAYFLPNPKVDPVSMANLNNDNVIDYVESRQLSSSSADKEEIVWIDGRNVYKDDKGVLRRSKWGAPPKRVAVVPKPFTGDLFRDYSFGDFDDDGKLELRVTDRARSTSVIVSQNDYDINFEAYRGLFR